MARKKRAEAVRTREHILDTAISLFHRKGLSATTLEEIAREAGVTRGAVYWHFMGKQDLLQAVLSRQALPLEVPLPEKTDFETGWRTLHQALVATLTDGRMRELTELLVHKSERVDDVSPVSCRLQQAQENMSEQIQRLLSHAVDTGELPRDLDTTAAGALLRTSISGLLFECLQRPADALRVPPLLDSLRHLLRHPPARLLKATTASETVHYLREQRQPGTPPSTQRSG